MIRCFKDPGTEDIFNGRDTRAAHRACPRSIWRVAARKLDLVDSVATLNDLRRPPGNRLELLKGNRKGQYSIRMNNRYRICFIWTETGPDEVEIADYH